MTQPSTKTYQPLLIETLEGQIVQFCIPEAFEPGLQNVNRLYVGKAHPSPEAVVNALPQQRQDFDAVRLSEFCNQRRIALITDDPCWGGVATHTFALAQHLAQQCGYQVAIGITRSADERLERLKVESGVQIYEISYDTVKNFVTTLEDGRITQTIIEEFSPDLVIFEDSCPFSLLAARELMLDCPIPFVCIEHLVEDYLAQNFAPQLPRLERVYSQARQVITVCEYGLKKLAQFKLPSTKGEIIYNGIGNDYFVPLFNDDKLELREDWAFNTEQNIQSIITVCRLSPEKRVDKLIQAFHILVTKRLPEANLELIIVGEGPQKEQLWELIQSLDMELNIFFTGQVPDVKPFLNLADLFVLVSDQEGLPMSILEAMAVGVPVLVSNVGGIPEMLGSQSPYLLSPTISPSELATVMRNFFVQDPLTRHQQVLTQKNYLVGRFMADAMLAKYEMLVNEIVAPKEYYDYVSPNLIPIDLRDRLPGIMSGVVQSNWEYLRKDIPHRMYFHKNHSDVGFLNLDEATIIYNLALQFPNANFLEIGCWYGWTTLHLLQVKGSHIWGVDPLLYAQLSGDGLTAVPSEWLAHMTQLIQMGNYGERFSSTALTSSEFFRTYDGEPFDLIMIDGNHEGDGPYHDAIAAAKVAADRCAIIFHDLVSPDVYKGLKALIDQGWKYRIYQTQQMIGVAYRGNFELPHHQCDPNVAWDWPPHIVQLSEGQPVKGEPSLVAAAEDDEFERIYQKVAEQQLSLLPKARLRQLFDNAKRVCVENIPGDFIECGAYKGGSAAIIFYVMETYSTRERIFYVLDTFEGMVEPQPIDQTFEGIPAEQAEGAQGDLACDAETVVANIHEIVTPMYNQLGMICMDVSKNFELFLRDTDTQIAFLHSDTDFYESTRATLFEAVPHLSEGAIVQVDDYHHWQGAKQAVDEFTTDFLQVDLHNIQAVGGVYFQWFKLALDVPVVLVAFNRPETTKEVVAAIAQAKPIDVFVIMDGARNEQEEILLAEVVEVIREGLPHTSITWLTEADHMGGPRRMISGLQQVFGLFEQAIILEDDCVPDPSFFIYCQRMLEQYENDPEIWHISGNTFQLQEDLDNILLSKFPHCWGWATWADRWQKAKMTAANEDLRDDIPALKRLVEANFGRVMVNDQVQFVDFWAEKFNQLISGDLHWDYLWQMKIWENKGLCILPPVNLVKNIGVRSGQNPPRSEVFATMFATQGTGEFIPKAEPDWVSLPMTYAQQFIYKDLFVQHAVFEQNYDSIIFQNEFLSVMMKAMNQLSSQWNRCTLEDVSLQRYMGSVLGLMSMLKLILRECDRTPADLLFHLVGNLNLIPAYFVEDSTRAYTMRAEFLDLLIKTWNFEQEWEMEPKMPDDPIRVGVIVESMAGQTEARANLPWVQMYGNNLEIILIAVSDPAPSELMDLAEQTAKQVWRVPDDYILGPMTAENLKGYLAYVVPKIREMNLDVVYFGTNLTAVSNLSVYLAQFRLSRYQVISHNCPVSPRFSAIDGYVTSSYLVGEDWFRSEVRNQFTEKLIVHDLPAQVFHTSLVFEQLGVPSLKELFGPDQFILACGANFFKYNEKMLEAFAEILAGHDKTCLYLYPFNTNWCDQYPKEMFRKFLSIFIRNYQIEPTRVRLQDKPYETRSGLLARLQGTHLYLDSFPYSGMTSLLDPLELKIPIVTCQGPLIASRMGASMMRALRLNMQIAHSKESYVRLVNNYVASYFGDRTLYDQLVEAFSHDPVRKFTDPQERLMFSIRLGGLVTDIIKPLVQNG